MHVLGVARINHGNRVAVYRVGVIPFVGVGHVIAFPSAKGWLSA